MDADERTAMLGDEGISLTQREFDLLYKLLSYPKKTFTQTQLMDEFWDVDTQTSTRTVDVYMTKLRAKLSECDSFEVQTVHGLGYKAVIKWKNAPLDERYCKESIIILCFSLCLPFSCPAQRCFLSTY